jgi:hypothetical protein
MPFRTAKHAKPHFRADFRLGEQPMQIVQPADNLIVK